MYNKTLTQASCCCCWPKRTDKLVSVDSNYKRIPLLFDVFFIGSNNVGRRRLYDKVVRVGSITFCYPFIQRSYKIIHPKNQILVKFYKAVRREARGKAWGMSNFAISFEWKVSRRWLLPSWLYSKSTNYIRGLGPSPALSIVMDRLSTSVPSWTNGYQARNRAVGMYYTLPHLPLIDITW